MVEAHVEQAGLQLRPVDAVITIHVVPAERVDGTSLPQLGQRGGVHAAGIAVMFPIGVVVRWEEGEVVPNCFPHFERLCEAALIE